MTLLKRLIMTSLAVILVLELASSSTQTTILTLREMLMVFVTTGILLEAIKLLNLHFRRPHQIPIKLGDYPLDYCYVSDIVSNYFIARTSTAGKVRMDPLFSQRAHREWFLDMGFQTF